MRAIVTRPARLLRAAVGARRALARGAVTGTCLVVLLTAMRLSGPAPTGPAVPAPRDGTTTLADWDAPPVLTADDSLRLEASLSPDQLHEPLERYFRRFNDDPVLTRRVARAVVREARRHDVAPSLVAAVLLTENTTLKPAAESPVGARGLMQVMPMHAGRLGCGSDDLVDVDSNICHGTWILAHNLRRSDSPTTALLRYNGCVRGTNTPDCHRYPGRVLARAGRVREEIIAAQPELPIAFALASR